MHQWDLSVKGMNALLTGQEQIADLEPHDARDVLDESGNIENHVFRVAVLTHLIVHLEPEANVVRVFDSALLDKFTVKYNDARDVRTGVEGAMTGEPT